MSTTDRYGLPLPPNNTLIATFPQMLREQSTELERRIPQAVDYEVRTALAPITVSGLALDADGVPYFRPGSRTLRVAQDADGTPYYYPA